MIITELYLKNFGKFHEERIVFDRGIHLLYGENEFGKTTLYAFIKAMLFGLERGRGKAASKDEFSRYEPWENPNYYAGQMDFLVGGRKFRISRNFDRYQKSVSLHCVDDGEELSVEMGDLEMLLGDLTRTTFESTIAIGQLGRKPGEELADELKNYAANYYTTGSANIDIAKTLTILQMRRKEAQRAWDKKREEQQKKRDLIEQEMGFIRLELKRIQEELREYEENEKQRGLTKWQTVEESKDIIDRGSRLSRDSRNARGNREDRESDEGGKIREGREGRAEKEDGRIASSSQRLLVNWHKLFGILSGFLLLGLIGWHLLSGVSALIFVIAVVVVGLLTLRFARFVKKRERNLGIPSKISEQRDKQQSWQLSRTQKEQRDKQIRLENLQEQFAELTEVGAEVIGLQEKAAAIELAIQRLQEVGTQLLASSGQVLNQRASQILGEITGGEYTQLWVKEDLNMEVTKSDKKIAVERLSGGTIEQIYFALRMAAVEILYEEPLPIILDEAFAFYDEKRLQSVLEWLHEQNRQVIILTCHKREKEALRRLETRRNI